MAAKATFSARASGIPGIPLWADPRRAKIPSNSGIAGTLCRNRVASVAARTMSRLPAANRIPDTSLMLCPGRAGTTLVLAASSTHVVSMARAAAELGLTYVHSTQGAYKMEEVAAANGDGSRWYQLYWPTDDELVVSFLSRATAAGYTHLVITLDTTLLGWRPLDLDLGYSPFLENKGIANYTSDPVFQRKHMPVPAEVAPLAAGVAFARVFQNPGLNWKQLPLIRANWDGPILLKGIQSPRDARLAVEHKIDGIVVSNHGGRQVDGAIASLDALSPIVTAVDGTMPVLFDSGIRTGRDAFKALALGADAVLIGRPYLYGLALGGQRGTRRVMQGLVDELEEEVRKARHRSHRTLSRSSLTRAR
jgi:lactate 2-monooxygenase